jgi:hypothetical protein
MLGRPDEAAAERARMLQLGRALGNIPSLAAALAFHLHTGLCLGWDAATVQEQSHTADELRVLCRDEGFFLWHAVALAYRGAAAAMQGRAEQACRLMNDGLAEFVQTGARLTLVPMNVMCAQAQLRLGDEAAAEKLLDAAQAEADARNERLWEPEVDRIRGALQRRRGDLAGAETALQHALGKARGQGAVSLAQRAEADLHALYLDSERAGQAQALIDAVAPVPNPACAATATPATPPVRATIT